MIADETLMGARKADPRELKPLKVRLPLEHVLQLHRMRILGNRTVSEIVAQALEDYLTGLNSASAQRKDEPKPPIER
jgi:hypothetical protein